MRYNVGHQPYWLHGLEFLAQLVFCNHSQDCNEKITHYIIIAAKLQLVLIVCSNLTNISIWIHLPWTHLKIKDFKSDLVLGHSFGWTILIAILYNYCMFQWLYVTGGNFILISGKRLLLRQSKKSSCWLVSSSHPRLALMLIRLSSLP